MNPVKKNRYLEETLALREELEGGFLILAERLKKIREERLWENEYGDFSEFLREMRISPSSASKLIGVYEKFVVMGGVKPEEIKKLGWTNLSIFLPCVQSKKDAREIFDKVSPLDRTDCMRTYDEMKRGIKMSECKHFNSYKIEICRDCNYKWEIYDEE